MTVTASPNGTLSHGSGKSGRKEATYLADHVDAKILLRAQDEKNRFAPKSLYNGYLGPQEETLHLSASQLDGFLTCPFMYLFTHVWKLDVKKQRRHFLHRTLWET